MNPDNQEEISLLLRSLESETFLFSLITINHRSLLVDVQEAIKEQFPARTQILFDADKANEHFVRSMLLSPKRIILIENFNTLLKDEKNREILIELNQRRDRFSELDIALIAFLWDEKETLQKIPKAIPDLYSVVFPRLNLSFKNETGISSIAGMESISFSSHRFKNVKEAKEVIATSIERLSNLQDTLENLRLRMNFLYSQAEAYMFLAEYTKALNVLTQIEQSFKKHQLKDELLLAVLLEEKGSVYLELGEYEESLNCFEKALNIQEKNLPENHPDLAKSYNKLGTVYGEQGDFEKSLFYFEKALDIQEKNLPENHPDLAMSYNNIGVAYEAQGDFVKGLWYKEKALTILEKILPENHPNLAKSYNNMGIAYEIQGNREKALDYYKKACLIAEISLPENHPNRMMYESNLKRLSITD